MAFKKGHIPKNKRLYPKIFDICWCGKCNEIVWNGNRYINGHASIGIKRSDLYILKQKESHKNQKSSFKGKHHTEETKKLLSINRKGKKFPKLSESKKGKKLSEHHKQRIKETHPDYTGENNPAWCGGISKLPYCKKWNEEKREEIRNKYNRKCVICGKDEKDNITTTGKFYRLSVHHTDYDKEQGCNGKQWKLVPLCMNCHAKRKTLNSMRDII